MYPGQMRTGKSKRMQQSSNGKGLLFLGGPSDCVPALGKALSLGFVPHVIDGSEEAPGLAWARKQGLPWGVASVYDFNWIHKTVLKNNWKIDSVVAVGVDVGPVCSLVSKVTGCFSIPYGITKLSWDKPALKKILSQAGVLTPTWGTFVVKPVDGRGSRGVSVVSASNLWGVEWEAAKRESPTGRVMCEEYVQGDGVSIEAIVWEGQSVFLGATDRIYNSSSQTVEVGGKAPSKYILDLYRCNLVNRVIEAIGIKMGSIKLDVIFRGDIPYVIEAAIGRLSGGLTCSHYIPLAFNVDFLAMAFAVYCGQDPRPFCKPILKTKHVPGQIDYFVSGRYDMPPNPSGNSDRGKFRLRIGRSIEEAERKLGKAIG